MSLRGILVSAAAVLLCAAAEPARAQPTSSSAATCPPGNLLAGRSPMQFEDIRGQTNLVTDGTAAVEGTLWNAPLAVVLESQVAQLTYDIGTVVPLAAVFVQADANDTYTVSGSVDGKDFRPLGQIGIAVGVHGLRSRPLGLGGVLVRYLRFGPSEGDGSYSLSELQAFCQLPTPFPPKLPTKSAQMAQVPTGILTYWNDQTSARWELMLAALGLGLLGWGHLLKREGRPEAHRKLRDRLLMTLGIVSALTYINFGFFHFPNFIHNWDTYHYYIGSKYFPELGYTRLYECVAVSDAEDPKLRHRVEVRKQTNLRTNLLEHTTEVLKHPERCKDHFTAERWESFKRDTAFFRAREGLPRWDDAQTDHGYNGTPVWNIAGTTLANLAPASLTQIVLLNLIDQAYLVAMIAIIGWAFGWRILSIALLVFATNFPSRFYWTGGAFLRWDWLFYTVASICCLKKDKSLLAGAFLAYATLLRIFPGFLFIGPLLALGHHLMKKRSLDPRYARFFVGAALATALLVPVSLAKSGGVEGYREFIQNTIKHKETPLTNHMGLHTLIAYRPWEVGRTLRNNKFDDPWVKWKEARLRSFKQTRPVFVMLVAVFLVALGFACRGADPWVAAALSATFIVIGAELTSYYLAFIIVVALLSERDDYIGRLLIFLTGFTQFVAWAPVPGMATWIDEQYTLMSLGTVIAFGIIVWRFGLGATRVTATVSGVAGTTEADTSPSTGKRRRHKPRVRPA